MCVRHIEKEISLSKNRKHNHFLGQSVEKPANHMSLYVLYVYSLSLGFILMEYSLADFPFRLCDTFHSLCTPALTPTAMVCVRNYVCCIFLIFVKKMKNLNAFCAWCKKSSETRIIIPYILRKILCFVLFECFRL